MNRRASTLIISVLLSSMLLCIAVASVLGQSGPTIQSVTPASGAVGTQVNIQGSIDTVNGSYLIHFANQIVVDSAANNTIVNSNFTVPTGFAAGDYNITLTDVIANLTATKTFTVTAVAPSAFAVIPISTFAIMGVAIGVALLNSGINRLLVSHFVGWNEYKSMQKEMAEWRSQQMAAVRANDKKQLEKLKKKESQIMNMQKQMAKPQMILFGISFVYIIVWIFVLTPTFGATTVAYFPGFENVNLANFIVFREHGAMGVFYWYPICSILFGTLASRIMGILPID